MNQTLPISLKLRAGHAQLEASARRADLLAAIEQSNRKARLANLPDHLDPEIIDPEKALAFRAGLSRLPAQLLQPLSGRTLLLNYPDLLVGASAPTDPSTFAQPFKLEVVDVQGDVVLARTLTQVDCRLARARLAEAKARLNGAELEVRQLQARLPELSGAPEKEHATLLALSTARLRRFALAQVWEQNARLCLDCPGAGPTDRQDWEAATHAVADYAQPRSSGMP